MTMVIHPGCVGTFFPADAGQLRAQVERLLTSAGSLPLAVEEGRGEGNPRSTYPHPDLLPEGKRTQCPKAIIAPHAGYDYSGSIAASAYAALAPGAGRIRQAVLLGTCHVVHTFGMLTTSADAIATPLGEVPVDQPATAKAARLPQVSIDDQAHQADHAIAVQLPFLQVLLAECRIVPLLVGRCDPGDVAAVLELLWGDEATVIVVSSDLSHFLDYEEACRYDRQTAAAITGLHDEAMGSESACGRRAIAGLLRVARRHRLRARELDVRNSGDTAGDRRRVVGYGAFAFEATSASDR